MFLEVSRNHFSKGWPNLGRTGQKLLRKGNIVRCMSKPEDGWLPVLFKGRREFVKIDAVSFIGPGLLMTPAKDIFK